MFTKGRILVATDFSDCASSAYPYAYAFAKAYGGDVHFAHIIDASVFAMGGTNGLWTTAEAVDQIRAGMMQYAKTELGKLVEHAEAAGVKAETHLEEGDPGHAMGDLASRVDAGLVVVSTHGRSGFEHIVFGSTSDHIVRHAPVPVLCVRPDEHDFVSKDSSDIQIKRVLFPIDFSPQADGMLPYAASLCRNFGAALHLVYVNELAVLLPEYLPEVAMSTTIDIEEETQRNLARIAGEIEGVEVVTSVRTGPAYREIIAAEKDIGADLIVMPTHGRTGLAHVLFGSVAERVVRMAKCPVLVVKPGNEV